jgi:hypothetical protein
MTEFHRAQSAGNLHCPQDTTPSPRHCEACGDVTIPPPRHCETHSAVAIQLL